jgi:predicted Zn-dependent peptidase
MTQHSTVLDNGLRLHILAAPQLHSVNVSFAVRCGSRHESPQQWGLAHFLEHMLFRGSKQFASSAILAEIFERGGGTLDASTWRDHTLFSVTVHPAHLRATLRALADMLIAPRFDDLCIERNIVEEELRAELNESDGDVDAANISRACVWGGHPMGRRITGSLQTLQMFSRTSLRQLHKKFYTAHNSVLAVAGAVCPREVAAMVRNFFGPMPAGAPVADGRAPSFTASCGACCHTYDSSQVGLLLTYAALPDSHPDFFAQSLLACILDDGMASRLPQALCDRRGLVYELSTGLDCYADAGLYDVEVQVAPHNVAAVLQVIRQSLHAIATEPVTAAELHRAVSRHLHDLDFRQDSTEELGQALAVRSLFGRLLRCSQEAAQLRKLTPQDLLRVAHGLFEGTPPHLTVLGPLRRAQLDALVAGSRLAA